MKIHFNHLKENIASKISIAELSDRLFQLGHEHEIHNQIFDIEFTPNRGDCLSIEGLLRDLSVFFELNEKKQIYTEKINPFLMEFENNSKFSCPQITFLKVEIKNNILDYHGSLKRYFNDLNVKKNNFFTDISNFVSYETGQPTHCYDNSKISGKLTLDEVEGEYNFKTITGKEIRLTEKNIVFKMEDEIINLAGVMGGQTTACDDSTRSVLIECAYFKPEYITGKGLKYDIQSDASHKFERNVDQLCHERVLRRFIKIIEDHADIKSIEIFSRIYEEYSENKIIFDIKKLRSIIGYDLSRNQSLKSLKRLGLNIENNVISVPSYRNDLKYENDIAEELARVIGYDIIPVKEISIPSRINQKQNQNLIVNNLKNYLIDCGYFEVINFPFINKSDAGSINLDNPIDSNKSYLRTELKQSLLDNLIYNENRQKDSVKLFEVSDIYRFDNGLKKTKKIGIISSGRIGKNYKEFSNFIDEEYIKNIFKPLLIDINTKIELISRNNLDSKIKNKIIYIEFDIHDAISNFLEEYEAISKKDKKNFVNYEKVSEFPSSYRDISFSVKKPKSVESLINALMNFENEILKEVFIFDFFNKNNENLTKIGFRFIFQSNQSTLTDEGINKVINDIIDISYKIDAVDIPGLKK